MTTTVHVVNLGPQLVEVTKVDSNGEVMNQEVKVLSVHQSLNEYVHSGQSLLITEIADGR